MSAQICRYKKSLPSHGQLWKVHVHNSLLHELEFVAYQQDRKATSPVHLLGNHQRRLLQRLGYCHGLEFDGPVRKASFLAKHTGLQIRLVVLRCDSD